MKKLMIMILAVTTLFALAACSDNNGGSGSGLAFYQIRDNSTGAVISLGDNISVFDEAFGEREFISEGVRFVGQARRTSRTYTYLGGIMMVSFDGEDETAVSIRITVTPEEAVAGRFSTLDVTLGMHQDDVVTLEGFSSLALAAGGTARILNADGEIRTAVGLVRVGWYVAMISVENEIAVGIMIAEGTD